MEEKTVLARVLWFNQAKGFGLLRGEGIDLDDIRINASTIEGISLFRDNLVEVTYKDDLVGLVATKLKVVKKG